MLTEVEIASMRETMLTVMPERATIQRKTETKAGLNVTSEWVSIATDVPCRIFEPTGVRSFEGESAGREASSAYPILRVPSSTDVNESDKVVVGNRTFEITRVVHNTMSFVTTLLTTEVR